MKATLEIQDEVNIRFRGLDIGTRRKLSEATKYFLPQAYHMPAFKLGRWDGCVRFCDIGARSYLALLDTLVPIVVDDGYDIIIDDKRHPYSFEFDEVIATSFEHICWPEGHQSAGLPVIPRKYQLQIINNFLKNPCSLQEVATGAGKTLITAILSAVVEKYGKSIVIVPNKQLVTQTEADYINMGLDVGVLFGDRKDFDKTHTICTWQSLEELRKSSKKGNAPIHIDDFLADVICVMVDEVHKAKADVLKDLLTGPFASVPIRWGLTGTIPKEEHNALSITCGIGPTIGNLSSKELRDQGVLANLDIDVVQMQDRGVDFKSYAQELKWLTTDPNRISAVSEIIHEYSQNGNTLVLVDRIATGQMLVEMNPEWVFISGKDDLKTREKEYAEISDSDNKVIIATYGIAAVGINIPRIFNLIMFEAGKSFVRVIQSIGRGVRKANDKDYVRIVDITSTCKFSKRHLGHRKKFYKEQEMPFKIIKRDY